MFSYARYRAAKGWLNRMKQRSGASLVRETDGFTYSQSLQGKTVFTLHAAKAFQHTDGHWVLHDVVITLYGLHDDRTDRVYGNEFEWDENQGIARAIGEVQMDLQVPSGVVVGPRHGSPATAASDTSANSIHVRTSGLVFLRRLGVAATQEQIEFHYGGLTCIARGAEFNNNPSSLHLLANVQMNGVLHGEPVALTASRADFDRSTNIALLAMPVMTTQDRKGHADSAVLHLRKDGSVERAEAMGNVVLDKDTVHLAAPRMDATMSAKNQPETARLSGGVKLVDDDAARPANGEAAEVRMRFDGQGRAQEVTAIGAARLSAREAAANGVPLEREMRGDKIVATFHAEEKGKPELQQVHATGTASIRGDSLAKGIGSQTPGLKATSIKGDDLLMRFVMGVRLDKLHGQGHTVLRQTAALGEEHVSSGDTLDAVFAPSEGGAQVASATQVGHVAITSRSAVKPGAKARAPEVATGFAERAAYDGAAARLSLNGGVHLADGGTSLAAESVVLDQATGDAQAHGNVAATLSGNGSQATHVAAQNAFLHKATQVAEFEGGAGRPARLWQDASQVEAAKITVDRLKNTLVARPGNAGGVVHSVFAGAPAVQTGVQPEKKRAPSILRVESRALDYSDAQHQAVFTGPVKMNGALGEVTGQRTLVFFTPAAKGAGKTAGLEGGLMGGGLDRVIVSGDVKLDEPGRHGTGEQLLYKAADESFVLTGTPAAPPRVVDTQQGSVTGTSLLFRASDSTIVVSGASAGEQRSQRAHIETRVRQKAQ
jgi:lipopolysaccharide export system protein LptA